MTDSASELWTRAAVIVRGLQDAWNAADSRAFAAHFAEDADFVNVYGMHFRGTGAIEHGHAFIFTGPYRGSTVAYTLESAREIRPGVAIAHVQAALAIPAGPMAGSHQARFSVVLAEDGERWPIASFQNTFITTPGGPPR